MPKRKSSPVGKRPVDKPSSAAELKVKEVKKSNTQGRGDKLNPRLFTEQLVYFSCETCYKIFEAKRDLVTHKNFTHKNGRFLCSKCPDVILKYNNAKMRHLATKHIGALKEEKRSLFIYECDTEARGDTSITLREYICKILTQRLLDTLDSDYQVGYQPPSVPSPIKKKRKVVRLCEANMNQIKYMVKSAVAYATTTNQKIDATASHQNQDDFEVTDTNLHESSQQKLSVFTEHQIVTEEQQQEVTKDGHFSIRSDVETDVQCANVDKDLNRAKDECSTQEQLLASLERQKVTLVKDVESAKQECKTDQEQLDKILKEKEGLDKDLNRAKDECSKQEQLLASLERQKVTLVKDQKDDCVNHKEQLEALKNGNEQLKTMLKFMSVDLDNMKRERDGYKADVASMATYKPAAVLDKEAMAEMTMLNAKYKKGWLQSARKTLLTMHSDMVGFLLVHDKLLLEKDD